MDKVGVMVGNCIPRDLVDLEMGMQYSVKVQKQEQGFSIGHGVPSWIAFRKADLSASASTLA